MKRVLMIAYPFPPMGGPGVQRTIKFAKYLPEFEWQPVILTVSNPPLSEADYSMLEELPSDLPVYRTPSVALYSIPSFLQRLVREFPQLGSRHSEPAGIVTLKSSSVKGKIRRTVANFVRTWFLIPDPAIGWLPTALLVGLKIAQECDVIYSTAAPFTDHIVACLLHKFSGKPWIADFRDPWTQYVIYQHSSRLRSRVDTCLEKYLLQVPDLVIVTCSSTAKDFQRLYPFLPEDKFIEITNGFDAEDFGRPARSSYDKFTITYTGRFCNEKNTSYSFLQALRELRREHPETACEIQVFFAGLFGEQNYALLRQWGLEEMVKPVGYVAHHESIKLLLESHVLLLTLNDERGTNLTYPGKLFEYLAARKPILALVTEGATADLVRKMDAGPVVSPTDVEAISHAILKLYNQYRRGRLLPSTNDHLRFERRALTRRLAQCLNAVLQG